MVTFARLHVFCGHFLLQTCTSRSHVFQDASLSHSKSQVSLTKRGRCSPEDGEARVSDVLPDDAASDVHSSRQRPDSAPSFGSVGSDGRSENSGGTSAANSISRKETERLAKLRVVASSFPCPVTETHPSATHDPAVGSQSHVVCESKVEPNHAVDKKVKFEPTEMTQSTAYWQLSSG